MKMEKIVSYLLDGIIKSIAQEILLIKVVVSEFEKTPLLASENRTYIKYQVNVKLKLANLRLKIK
jgi:hypothetical protein